MEILLNMEKKGYNLTNILLVDDNKNDIELVMHHLKSSFEDVLFTVANNKSEFIERLSWVIPDLIVSDFDLRDCDGLELLMHTRTITDVPFIFVSGTLNDSDKLSRSILAGANGYVMKSNLVVLPEVIQSIMDKELENRELNLSKKAEITKVKIRINRSIASFANDEKFKSTIEDLQAIKNSLDVIFD